MTTLVDPGPLLDSVPGAQARLGGIGRSQLYELLAQGELESVKIGRRRMITVASMVAYVDRQTQTVPDGAA